MILCCGEALIDMVPREVDGQDGFLPVAGGAVMNTAVTLGRLGNESGFFYGVSTDLFGDVITEHLAESKVNTSLLARSGRPTTLAFVKLIDGQARYVFYDENSAGRMITREDLPTELSDINALFFGGISLCVEPCGGVLEDFALANSHDKVVMLDPNIRPSFIKDPEAYRARVLHMISAADVVKTSDEDLDWIVPGPAPVTEKIDEIVHSGPSVLILTKGGDGAEAYTPSGTRAHVHANKVDVVDTIGAGDSFNGGALSYLSDHGLLDKTALKHISADHLTAMLLKAASVAAVTVSRAGANPPWAHEL